MHRDAAGDADQFRVKGGDNSVQEYGSKGSESDYTEAAASLHAYLDARAAGAWSVACGYLDPALVDQLVEIYSRVGSGKSCPRALAAVSAQASPRALKEAAEVDAAALRVEGQSGFLLLRDSLEVAYFIPMRRQGETWRVAAPAASPLPGA